MTSSTFERRLDQLMQQLYTHPYKEELLTLMDEQLAADTIVLEQERFPA